jgi:hypothetical protein
MEIKFLELIGDVGIVAEIPVFTTAPVNDIVYIVAIAFVIPAPAPATINEKSNEVNTQLLGTRKG